MKWEPWETFKANSEVLDISEPPCKDCKFWKPQNRYAHTPNGFIFYGIVCCHTYDGQESDFSCYKQKGGK